MTLLELAPFAAVVAAAGVAVLLTRSETPARLAAAMLVAAGSAPLVLLRFPNLGDRIADDPVVALAGSAAALILLAVLVAAFVRAPWLCVVLALLLSLRIPLNPGDPSPTDHLAPLWVVVAAGLIAQLWLAARAERPPRLRLGHVGVALAAYVVLAAVSLFWSDGREHGAYNFVAFYIPLGTLAAVIGTMSMRPPLGRSLTTAQIVLGAAVAIAAIVQVANGGLWWNDELIFGNTQVGYVRANGLFWDASELGRYLALAIVTVVGVLALDRANRRSVLGGALLSALMFAGLFLSYSRAGVAALVLGIGLVAVVWRPQRAKVAGIGLLLLAVLVAVAAIVADGDFNELTSNREALAETGVDAFGSAPIGGVGLGGYPDSHSIVLGVAAELGLLGIAALIAIVVTVGFAALRPAAPATAPMFRALAAISLVMLFAHSMVDAGLFDNGFAWGLAAILAVLAAPPEEPQPALVREPALAPAGSATTSIS